MDFSAIVCKKRQNYASEDLYNVKKLTIIILHISCQYIEKK